MMHQKGTQLQHARGRFGAPPEKFRLNRNRGSHIIRAPRPNPGLDKGMENPVKRAAAALALMTLFSLSLRAQSTAPPDDAAGEEVVRVSTSLVTVPVSVRTRKGAYVTNLRREDFRIYEDGVAQEVAHFEAVDKPFTVALLLDVSDSARGELEAIQDAAVAFLEQLRPHDRALVISFDRRVVRLTGATGDRRTLADAIRRVRPGGGTALYDALEGALREHLKAAPGRKAVVLLTDGIDTSSARATYESALRAAEEEYALVYPIQWNTPERLYSEQRLRGDPAAVTYTTPGGEPLRKAYERGTRFLRLAAEASGGRFQHADGLKNLERSFARIAEELRRQYGLGYYPRNPAAKGRRRRIKVEVGVADADVRARDSYTHTPDPR
jgi:Ca-activated chloride channel family protein